MNELILIFLFIFISIGTSLLSAQRDCLQQAELDALGRTMRPEKDTFAISLINIEVWLSEVTTAFSISSIS